jgi:hypothetical protein
VNISTNRRPRAARRIFAVAILAPLVASGATIDRTASASADPITPGAGQFVPVQPARVVKTTANIGWTGQIQTGQTQNVTVTGTNGVPGSGVSAVMLHVTTLNATSTAVRSGFLWVWPTGSPKPSVAVVANAGTGDTADNSVIVQVDTNGQVSFADGPQSAPVDVIADVEGYVTSDATTSAGATFAPLPQTRVLDTQAGTGGRSTPLTSAEGVWTYHLAGVGGVPTSGVSAVALNLGAKNTISDCWVEVQPNGTATNFAYPRVYTYSGYTAQQLAVVPMSAGGNVAFTTNCASTNIYLDVEGYYLSASNGSSGDVYVPIESPTRVIDTQTNTGITGQMTAGRIVQGSNAVAVAGVAGVPAYADVVALSVQALNALAGGYNTIWTDGTPQPTQSSTIDVDPNVPQSNLVFVQTGANGKIDVADPSGGSQSNDLTVDIEGYFYLPRPNDITDSTLCATPTDGGCAQPANVTSLTPQLQATTTDRSGGQLTYSFELDAANADGTLTLLASGTSASAASGATASWTPPAALTNYADYEFRVRASNGYLSSQWSNWYVFGTDAPTVHSIAPTTVYDSTADSVGAFSPGEKRAVPLAGANGIPAGGPGGTDAVTIAITATPVSGASGHLDMATTDPAATGASVVGFAGTPATSAIRINVGGDGGVDVTNVSSGSVHVRIVVTAWISLEPADAAALGSPAGPDSTLDTFDQAVDSADASGPLPTDGDPLTVDENPADIPDGTDAALVKSAMLSEPSDAASCDSGPCDVAVSNTPTSDQVAYVDGAIAAANANGSGQSSADASYDSVSPDVAATASNGTPVQGRPPAFRQCPSWLKFLSRTHFCKSWYVENQWIDPTSVGGNGSSTIFLQQEDYLSTSTNTIVTVWTFAILKGFLVGGTDQKWSNMTLSNGVDSHPVNDFTVKFNTWYHINWKQVIPVGASQPVGSRASLEWHWTLDPAQTFPAVYTKSHVQVYGAWRRTDNYPYLNNSLGPNRPGSILPAVKPTFVVDHNVYPRAAKFINRALWNLFNHPGNRWWRRNVNLDNPLSRMRNDTLRAANRNYACPESYTRTLTRPNNTCDEYPFAATYQGAWIMGGAPWYLWARQSMPGWQNFGVGGKWAGFLKQYRVIDGDDFWVEVHNLPLYCGNACG